MAQKWEQSDNLRTMTSKFNSAVDELEGLKESSNQQHQEIGEQIEQLTQSTNEGFEQLTQSVNQNFQQVNQKLDRKLEEVSAEDLGLENVDNTSDMDKPVSTAQQKAIDDATADMITSEASEQSVESAGGEEPEISPLVKSYVESVTGNLENLSTNSKKSLVEAINETFQLGSEMKKTLVENLTAKGVSCSTSESWTTLLGYILTIGTST